MKIECAFIEIIRLISPGIAYVQSISAPSHNKELFGRIAAKGSILTQFPFNCPADKQSFPIRNRSVAGMTLGTLVVEANLTSIDEIIRASGPPSSAVSVALCSLGMKRLVRQLPGKLFLRNRRH